MSTTLSVPTINNLASLVAGYWLDNPELCLPNDALNPALHDNPAYSAYELYKDHDSRRAVLEMTHSMLAEKLGKRKFGDELNRRKRNARVNQPVKASPDSLVAVRADS
jgi:hypothetical protein